MEFYVDKLSETRREEFNFFINVASKAFPCFDYRMARLLDLTIDEYQNILKKYGGKLIDEEVMFDTFEDCERALNSEELLPKIIMLKLIG